MASATVFMIAGLQMVKRKVPTDKASSQSMAPKSMAPKLVAFSRSELKAGATAKLALFPCSPCYCFIATVGLEPCVTGVDSNRPLVLW